MALRRKKGKNETWSIDWAEVNPKYSSKKIGFSVMSAAYERMADSGVDIESDTTQSPGGASIWKRLLKNKKNRVHAIDDRKISKSPLKGMKDENDIWWTPESEKEADKRLGRLERIAYNPKGSDADRLKYYSEIEKEENRKEKIGGRSLLLKGKSALESYGKNIGLAFQIADDALDYYSKEIIFGKKIGKDFYEGKVTLPLIIIFQRADSNERKFLVEIFKKSQRTKEDFDLTLQLIKKYKAVEDSLQRAEYFVNVSHDTLGIFKDCPEKKILQNLTGFSLNRSF